uniref:PA domain-containing protein n=1 Tax=Naja naja TaxID=35670 RepID=A0A8C7E7N2_NAJNA
MVKKNVGFHIVWQKDFRFKGRKLVQETGAPIGPVCSSLKQLRFPPETEAAFATLCALRNCKLGFRNTIVVKRGNCTFLEKAEIAQRFGAKLLLVRSPGGNKTQNLTIPIALVKDTLGRNVNVGLYSPPQPIFDYSLVIIFLIAMFCVSLGGYWSGRAELEKLKRGPNPGSNESLSDEETLTLTPLSTVIFVSSCCIMLVLMYFFYKWLVYVVIAIFCLASVSSMYCCLSALLKKIPYGQCRLPCELCGPIKMARSRDLMDPEGT